MFARLKTIISDQAFNPGFLGLFLNPFYFARKGLHHHLEELAPQLRGLLLDVGCGSKPYRDLFDVEKHIGLEMEGRDKVADTYYLDGLEKLDNDISGKAALN